MMKSKDVSAATSLLIQGYLRANSAGTRPEVAELADCLRAIRGECVDWAENLLTEDDDPSAMAPEKLSVSVTDQVGGTINRTPFNLVSAALVALAEAIDLAGPDTIWSDFDSRKIDFLAAPGS